MQGQGRTQDWAGRLPIARQVQGQPWLTPLASSGQEWPSETEVPPRLLHGPVTGGGRPEKGMAFGEGLSAVESCSCVVLGGVAVSADGTPSSQSKNISLKTDRVAQGQSQHSGGDDNLMGLKSSKAACPFLSRAGGSEETPLFPALP